MSILYGLDRNMNEYRLGEFLDITITYRIQRIHILNIYFKLFVNSKSIYFTLNHLYSNAYYNVRIYDILYFLQCILYISYICRRLG